MRYLECKTYCDDVRTAIRHTVSFERFRNKKILLVGASGLIGSFMADCFLYANAEMDAKISLYAAGRSRRHFADRFGEEKGGLYFVEADVTELSLADDFDYVIHAASYGHPQAFRETPVEVLLANVVGTDRVLKLAMRNRACRVLYVSSGEVQETVDHLSYRACYPMGKRAAETLCISYRKEYGVDALIARPCHTFGPNITKQDNRAAAQFLRAAAGKTDIEMYSAGEQLRSFAYVADCVSGLLTVLAGGDGETLYGISADESCTVREFAEYCADAGGCSVKFHLPDETEKAEISPINKQIVDNGELSALGWQAAFSIETGIQRSVQIMREMGGR